MKIHEASDFSDLQFVEKMQKQIHKLPKYFANCKLRMANLTLISLEPHVHDFFQFSKF